MKLRIGTYNIAGGKSGRKPEDVGENEARLERILRRIASLRCDLLGIVEVRANPAGPYPDPSARIALEAQNLGFHYSCFAASLSQGAFGDETARGAVPRGLYAGNMLLSRYPIARYHSFLISDFCPYDGRRDTEPRHFLLALVTLPDQSPLYIGVTHLHTIRERNRPIAADVRKVQCERILAVIKDLPGLDTTPLLLVGDFNNNPHLDRADNREPEIQVLLRELSDLSEVSGGTRIRREYDPPSPVRIDRVFGNRCVQLVDTEPSGDALDPDPSSEMFVNHDGFTLSDHQPVVVTIETQPAA